MLGIFSQPNSHHGTISRRHFLTVGALGGLSLTDLLRAEEAAGIGSSSKSIINIHLDGGPPHMDMIDLKPEAPAEIRGDFKPIQSRIAGLAICEHLPRIASIADKFVFIRSLVGADNKHDAFQCQSGFTASDLRGVGGRPAMGSVLSKLWGRPSDSAPTFVDLMLGRPLVRNSARPGYLRAAYGPFRPDISHLFQRELEDAMKKELAGLGQSHSVALGLQDGLSNGRLANRKNLLAALNQIRQNAETSGQLEAMDHFRQQAFNVLTSGRIADAMDFDQEDPRIIDRYTPPTSGAEKPHYTSEDGNSVKKLLLARRLIEAGVRCVSLSISDFDTHSNNFPRMRYLLPIVDYGLHALITDLDERGMLNDVSIVVWGEFGRTPTIDAKGGGRHHWPRVGMALLAGGGMKTGQVIGQTDRHAAEATDRPVHYQEVFATLYHNLGINLRSTTLKDEIGRPHHLLNQAQPIHEVT